MAEKIEHPTGLDAAEQSEHERNEQPHDVVFVISLLNAPDTDTSALHALDWLIAKFPSEYVGTIENFSGYADAQWPPVLEPTPDGPILTWPRPRATSVQLPRHRIVAMHVPVPTSEWRELSRQIMGLLAKFDSSKVVILSTVPGPVPHTRPLPVTRFSTDPTMQELFPISEDEPGPKGFATVLQYELSRAGVTTIRAEVTVPDYIRSIPNPQAILAHLEEISYLLKEPLNVDELRKEATAWTSMADEIAIEDPEVGTHIAELEAEMDASYISPKGEVIAKELEHYLKRLDQED